MDILHPFEEAGLGKAPFRCYGVERRVGPLDMGNGAFAGAPGQPMGSCHFCGQGIADCYLILSADGKKFVVGSDCVRRTYSVSNTDIPLDIRRAISDMAKAKREIKREAAHTKLMARVDKAQRALDNHTWLFCGITHPNAYYASQGKNYRDYLAFLLKWGGTAGKTEACKIIEQEDARAAG